MPKIIARMKSENWGGLASMTGSLIALASGDAEGVISSIAFIASEIGLARKGHTSWGYSLGCAGIGFGDGLLCFSHATGGNPALQSTMALLAALWGLGAMRYPVERTGKAVLPYSKRAGSFLQKTADAIPPVAGTAILMLRLPALCTAAFTGAHFNAVMFACNLFWGASDILLGRVHRFVEGPVKTFARWLTG